MDNTISNFVWTDGIEDALNEIKTNSYYNSDYHKQNYYFFKGYLKYFRIPTIVLSGMNSVFSVGLQPYLSQGIISVLCCSLSLICGIIASVELFLGIQNMMEKELITSKDFYILSSDIFKTLSVERQYRTLDGKIYLDNIHTKYCNLIEQCNLLNKKVENIQITNIPVRDEVEERKSQWGTNLRGIIPDNSHSESHVTQPEEEKIVLKIVKDARETFGERKPKEFMSLPKQKEENTTKIKIQEWPNSFELRSPEFSRSPTASRQEIFANIEYENL